MKTLVTDDNSRDYACAVAHLETAQTIAADHPNNPASFSALAAHIDHAREHLDHIIHTDWEFNAAKRLSELRTLATDWLSAVSDADIRALAIGHGFPAVYLVGTAVVSANSLRWWPNPGYAPNTAGKDNAINAARERFTKRHPDLAYVYDGTPFVA